MIKRVGLSLFLFIVMCLSISNDVFSQEKQIFREKFTSTNTSEWVLETTIGNNNSETWDIVEHCNFLPCTLSDSSPYMVYSSGSKYNLSPNTRPEYSDNVHAILVTKEFYNLNNELYASTEEINLSFYANIRDALGDYGDNFDVILYTYDYDGSNGQVFELLNLKSTVGRDCSDCEWSFIDLAIKDDIPSNKKFKIGFVFRSDNSWGGEGEGVYLDNITLDYIPSLTKPSLLFPEDGISVGPKKDLNFSWDPVTNADSYKIQFSNSDKFESIITEKGSIENTYLQLNSAEFESGEIYWRVKAKDGIVESEWSTIRSFTIENPSVEITNPSSGTSWERGKEYTIEWDTNVGGNIDIWLYRNYEYQFQIAEDISNDGSHNWPIPSDLSPSSNYRLRVGHRNYDIGTTNSDWFEIISTDPKLTVPTSLTFGEIEVGKSDFRTYQLEGSNLTESITITSPEGFSISETNSNYDSEITISASDVNATAEKTIYVKFEPNSEGAYEGQIVHSSSEINTKYLKVTGTGVAPPQDPYITVTDSPISFGDVQVNNSLTKSYTINGSNLTQSVSISSSNSIFTVSTSENGTYEQTKTLTASTVESGKEIFIKFSPTASTNYQAEITNDSDEVSSKIITVEGTGTPVGDPLLAVSPSDHVLNIGSDQGTTEFNIYNDGQGTLEWSVSEQVSWLDITSPSSGTGAETVAIDYESYSGASRSGIITVNSSNASNTPIEVTITQTGNSDLPDLTVNNITYPKSVSRGDTVEVSFKIVNEGNAVATKGWRTEVFLTEYKDRISRNTPHKPDYDHSVHSDSLLVSFEINEEIGIGEEKSISKNIRIPLIEKYADYNYDVASKYLTVDVNAFAYSRERYEYNTIEESSTENNVISGEEEVTINGFNPKLELPDFTINSFGFDEYEISLGDTLKGRIILGNVGEKGFKKFKPELSIYISSSSELNQSSINVDSGTLSKYGPLPGEEVSFDYIIKPNNNFPEGNSYLIAVLDEDLEIPDINRTNNVLNTPKPIVLSKPDKEVEVVYKKGWNLVSLPVQEDSGKMSDYWGSVIEVGAYKFEEQYRKTESIKSGKGYWVKLDSDKTVVFNGAVISSSTVTLKAGWNLVGSIGKVISVPSDIHDPNNIIEGSKVWKRVHNSSTGEYHLVETTQMEPGRGYFIKATSQGEITLSN